MKKIAKGTLRFWFEWRCVIPYTIVAILILGLFYGIGYFIASMDWVETSSKPPWAHWNKFWEAFIYPAILAVVILIISIVMLTFHSLYLIGQKADMALRKWAYINGKHKQ